MTAGQRAFHRSRPASASAFLAARAISMTGIGAHSSTRGRRAGARPAALHGGPRLLALRFGLGRVVVGGRAALLRRLHARWFAGLLAVLRWPRSVAQAAGFVTCRQVEERLERADRFVDPGSRIAAFGEDRGHGRQRERLGLDRRDLVPKQRHRDARVGERPNRVGRRDGPVLGVLVVIEEDAVALLLPPFRRRDRRCPPLHVARQRQRGAAHLRVRPARLDPDVDVDPAGARGLRPAGQADGLERLARDERDVADLRPRHTRDRVQVHSQLVGVVEIAGSDGVRVEVDATEVGDPGETGRFVEDDLVGGPTRREGQRGDPDELGPLVRRTLLEERLPGRAVHEPLEGHRTVSHATERAVGHGHVVADEVELGVSGLGEVDLVRVGDGHLPAADLDDLLTLGHGATIPRRGTLTPGRRVRAASTAVSIRRRPFVVRVTGGRRAATIARPGGPQCATCS